FEGHSRPILGAVVSRDGKTLYTASHDSTLRKWDLATGNELQQSTPATGSWLKSLGVSPDGRTLAVGHLSTRESKVQLVDAGTLKNGERLTAGRKGWINEPFFTAKGQLVGQDVSREVYRWDLATGKILAQFNTKDLGVYENDHAFTLAPDGRTAAFSFRAG